MLRAESFCFVLSSTIYSKRKRLWQFLDTFRFNNLFHVLEDN